jgi:hypothetical protein
VCFFFLLSNSFDYCVKEGLAREAEGLRGAFEVAARSLVSANATLAAPCLRALAKALQGVAYAAASGPSLPPPLPPAAVVSGVPPTSADGGPIDAAAALAARVVDMVVGVVGAVPTAGASLVGCFFAEHFPHRFRDERCLVVYARGLLEVARRLPRLSGDLVALLVDRCLEIDVEIKLDEFGAARLTGQAAAVGGAAGGGSESEGEDEEEDPMLLGFGTPLGKLTAPPGGVPPVASSASPCAAFSVTAPLAVDEMAAKLDGLMLELFKHLDHVLVPKLAHHQDSLAPATPRSSSAPDLTRTGSSSSSSSSSSLTASASTPSLDAGARAHPTGAASSWGGVLDAGSSLEDSPRSPAGYPSLSLSPPRRSPWPAAQAVCGQPPDADAAARLWQALHGAFDAKVLLTHRSKFVQFLLLRFVHLAPQHGPTFASRLLKTATDKRVPHVRRVNAVSHETTAHAHNSFLFFLTAVIFFARYFFSRVFSLLFSLIQSLQVSESSNVSDLRFVFEAALSVRFWCFFPALCRSPFLSDALGMPAQTPLVPRRCTIWRPSWRAPKRSRRAPSSTPSKACWRGAKPSCQTRRRSTARGRPPRRTRRRRTRLPRGRGLRPRPSRRTPRVWRGASRRAPPAAAAAATAAAG